MSLNAGQRRTAKERQNRADMNSNEPLKVEDQPLSYWGIEVVSTYPNGAVHKFRRITEHTKPKRVHSPRKTQEATPEELEELYPV